MRNAQIQIVVNVPIQNLFVKNVKTPKIIYFYKMVNANPNVMKVSAFKFDIYSECTNRFWRRFK